MCCDSADSEDDDESIHKTLLDEKLYHGSSITVREFVLTIGLMKSSSNQPDSHTCRTLELFSRVLPQPNNCPSSLYKFKKYFNSTNEPILKKHYFCSNCITPVQNINHDVNNDESIEGEKIFDNAVACQCDEKLNYFIEMPH